MRRDAQRWSSATGMVREHAQAARQAAVPEYATECRRLLGRPAAVSAFFRGMIRSGWASCLASLIPGQWMYRLTRV